VAQTATKRKQLDPSQTGRRALRLERGLRRLIVGQDEAIEQIINVYQTYLAGMSAPSRPIGNFLFLGPTGTGKTRAVEATAETLAGDARAVIKIDCAEFQHSHEIAKLIGSPPGYLGHRETHPLLSQDVLKQHHSDDCQISFVLFDEIEKAHPDVFNIFLQILDDGRLTDGQGRTVDFRNTVLVMTSNIGSQHIIDLGVSEQDEMRSRVTEALRSHFKPEFLNRIDDVVIFNPLGQEQIGYILEIQLDELRGRLAERRISLELSDEAISFLATRGYDPQYGARPLKRLLQREEIGRAHV